MKAVSYRDHTEMCAIPLNTRENNKQESLSVENLSEAITVSQSPGYKEASLPFLVSACQEYRFATCSHVIRGNYANV